MIWAGAHAESLLSIIHGFVSIASVRILGIPTEGAIRYYAGYSGKIERNLEVQIV